MCEIFGAYGWGETINEMKWLVDFMLVRGVNYFVPHAFNPRTEDTDCPPYFYHGGKNPTFSAFKELMKYSEQRCEELSEDYSVKVAVLYHAEADWGGSRYTPMDKVCRLLTEKQIDFEIVPSEYLDRTKAKILIVPYAACWGKTVENRISRFQGRVIFANEKNRGLLSRLNVYLSKEGGRYALKRANKYVRILKRGEKYFLFNEGLDTVENTLITETGETYPFKLLAGESVLFRKGDVQPQFEDTGKRIATDCFIRVRSSDLDEYETVGNGNYTEDLNARKGYERFTGKVRYETTFRVENDRNCVLDFGEVVGGLKVWVNGKEYDELFGAPYRLNVSEAVRKGENELVFELSTTLALKYKDLFSSYAKVDKCGMPERIKLLSVREE